MITDNPKYISSSQPVVIIDPYVIFFNLIPATVTWDNTAQSEYYIVNSTNAIIPLLSGTFYFDANAVKQTVLQAGISLDIVRDGLGNWNQVIAPSGGGSNTVNIVPIATYTTLGVIKVGNNLTVAGDGTLSASFSSSSVDWSSIVNKPVFSTVSFTGSYVDLSNKPVVPTLVSQLTNDIGFITSSSLIWTNISGKPVIPTLVSQLTNDSNFITLSSLTWGNVTSKPTFAVVATTGSYNDLSNKAVIPAQVNIIAGSNVSVSGTYPNITVASTGGGGGGGVWGSIIGTLSSQTDLNTALNARLLASNNLSDLTNASTARASLALGSAALQNTAAFLQPSNNLSDVGNTATARTNLGVPAQVSLTAGTNVSITGTYPNLTITASGAGATITSLPKASDLGILANGTDQTSALNTIFANSNYMGIVMDFLGGGAVTITGTVSCGGKVIVFAPGSYFTGTGTIASAVINAGYRQKCFDVNSSKSINVSLSTCSIYNGRFSALWYGAPGGSYEVSIQKCIDTIIANANTMMTLFFPSQGYVIAKPLIAAVYSGGTYQSITMRFEGETPMWEKSGTASVISCSFKDTFALGIQLGKGVEIKNLKFIGGFTPPFSANVYGFFTSTFSNFVDGVSRDQNNSPYAGILVDPFGPSVPGDGGYPGTDAWGTSLSSYYRGGGSGSTGTILEDIFISNFVVGFATSISGGTANGELTKIDKIQFEACKICIVGSQDQEKLNVVTQLACWGNTHTIFCSGTGYGKPGPGHWVFNGMNLAGSVVQIVLRSGAGFFPVHMSNIYAESVGSIGTWSGTQGDSLTDSSIDFVNLNVFAAYPAGSHFNNSGVTVKNTTLRYYDAATTNPVWLNGGGKYENCTFSTTPYISNYFLSSLVDCVVGGFSGPINSKRPAITYGQKQAGGGYNSGGNSIFIDSIQTSSGKRLSLTSVDPRYYTLLSVAGSSGNYGGNSASTISITSNVATITPPGGSADLARVSVGRLVINLDNGVPIGIVSSIGGSTYTVAYVPDGITTSSNIVGILYPNTFGSFMGDIVAGSPTINNVVLDFSYGSDLTSRFLADGFVRIPGFYKFRGWDMEGRILNYNSGAATITMDRPAAYTATNFFFSNGSAVKTIELMGDGSGSGASIANAEILPVGGQLIISTPPGGRQIYDITKTGYWNQSPQAQWTARGFVCCTTSTTTTTTTTV